MQKRNLFVYCAKTATFPLAACYTFALSKNIFLKTKELLSNRKGLQQLVTRSAGTVGFIYFFKT